MRRIELNRIEFVNLIIKKTSSNIMYSVLNKKYLKLFVI